MSQFEPHFNGPEYLPPRDHDRLASQNARVLALMIDGVWRTHAEIAAAIGDSNQSSLSAQLRHLRKDRFGAYIVSKRSRSKHLFEYQLVPRIKETLFEI